MSKPFDAAFKRAAAPRLTALGFVNKGINWTRVHKGRGQTVRFERGKYNATFSGRVTVMLMSSPTFGVGVKSEAERLAWKGEMWPAALGAPALDIGVIMPERLTRWYSYALPSEQWPGDLTPAKLAAIETLAEAAIHEMMDDLERYGLPWLARPSILGVPGTPFAGLFQKLLGPTRPS